MPRGASRYSNLSVNPYSDYQINVGYFDRKALEKQQRHDVAAENYSKFAQSVADTKYLDQSARDAYLNEMNANFDEVLNKNAGNLSAGYQDVLKAIEKSKMSPYHNLNARQVEQSAIADNLRAQYGARAIDLSTLNQPLMKRDKEGNIQWANPSDLKAEVYQADDYGQIIEKMLAETTAHKFTDQSGLMNSNNAYYLMSRIQSGEVLTPQELMQIAKDPSVQQAFLSNTSTAGIDNRKIAGSDMTYKEMFSDPNKLAQWIYGNIQDKQRNNINTQYQFQQNIGAVEALRAKKAKEQAAYEQNLKNLYMKPFEQDVPFGEVSMTGKDIKDIKTNLQTMKLSQMDLLKNMDNNAKEFGSYIGLSNPNMTDYMNPDGKFNRELAKNLLEVNNTDPNKINDLLDAAELSFRNYNDTRKQKDLLNNDIYDQQNYINGVETKVVSDFMKELPDFNKQELSRMGINSPEQLKAKLDTYTSPGPLDKLRHAFGKVFGGKYDLGSQGDPVSNAALGYFGVTPFDNIAYKFDNYQNDKYTNGFKTGVMESSKVSNDPKSLAYQHNDLLKTNASTIGYKDYLSTFTDVNGNSLVENAIDIDNKGNSTTLRDFLNDNVIDPKNSQFLLSNRNEKSDGYRTNIILRSKPDKDGNWNEFKITNAEPPNSNKLGNEIATRHVAQAYTLFGASEDYNDRFLEDANAIYGATLYGGQTYDKTNLLFSPGTNVGTKFNIPMTLSNGQTTNTMIKKLPNGYMAMIGDNPNNKIFIENPNNDIDPNATNKAVANFKRMLDTKMGSMNLLYGNSNFETLLGYYNNNNNKLPSIGSNIAKSKK